MVSPGGGGWSTRRGPLRQRCHGAPERGPVRDTPNGSTGARFWPGSAVFTSAVWHSCRVQSVRGTAGSRERGSGASRAVETEQAPGSSCAGESWLTMKLTLTDDAMGACIAARGSEPTRSRVGMQLRIDVTATGWRLSATSSAVTSAATVPEIRSAGNPRCRKSWVPEIVVCCGTGSVPALSGSAAAVALPHGLGANSQNSVNSPEADSSWAVG